MYNAKKTSPINNMKFIQYKFDVGFKNNVKREPKSEIEDSSIQLELMDSFYEVKREKPTDICFDMDENGVISYSDPFCKHCHSHKVTKHGHNVRDLITEDGEHYIAKVQRYYCGNYSQTEFTD